MNGEIIKVHLFSQIPKHLIVAGSAWISRIIVALIQLASIRLLMDSIGLEKYAVFALLTGLMGWFILAEMGIGVSTQNYISESRAENKSCDAIIAASGAVALLLLCITIIALYFISPYLAPVLLKQFLFLSELEKIKLFFITGSLFIGFGIGGVAYKVWYAEQRGYRANIIFALSHVIGFIGLLFVRGAPVEDRLLLSLVAFVAPTALLPLTVLIGQQMRKASWNGRTNIANQHVEIIKRGFYFWLFSVMAAGVLQIDYIVMSQFLTPHDIAAYLIATRIFGLALFIYTSVLMALWPLFAELLVKREWLTVTQYLKKYLIVGLVYMAVCTVLLTWLMPEVLKILATKEIIILPLSFILLLGIYHMLRVWTDTFSMTLQSMNDLKPFWIYVPVQAALSIGLQWTLAPVFGLNGIVMGLIASYIFTVMWALPLSVKKHYKFHHRVR